MRNDARQVDENMAPVEGRTQKNSKYAKMQQCVQVHVLTPPPSTHPPHSISFYQSLHLNSFCGHGCCEWRTYLTCVRIDLYVKRYVVH